MGDFFKPFVDFIKGIHPLTAGLVATGLWILLYQISSSADVSTKLVVSNYVVAFPAALALTILALDGLIKSLRAASRERQAMEKRRQIIRDLTENCKNILWSFLALHRRTREDTGMSGCDHLHDIGVLEYGRDFHHRIADDYWDMLVEEGWTLLYEGRERPSNPPPETAFK